MLKETDCPVPLLIENYAKVSWLSLLKNSVNSSTHFSSDFFPSTNMHITYTVVHRDFFPSKLYLQNHSISGTLICFFPFNDCRVKHVMVTCDLIPNG